MKNLSPYISPLLIGLGAVIIAAGFIPPHYDTDYDLAAFGRLPVEFGGRVLPLDSVARNTLRVFSGRTELNADPTTAWPNGLHMPAIQWFLELALHPTEADSLPVFRVDNDEVLGLLGREQMGKQIFTYHDLAPFMTKIEDAATAANNNRQGDATLSAYESEVLRLRDNLGEYSRLGISFIPPGDEPAKTWDSWQQLLRPGAAAVLAYQHNQSYDKDTLADFMSMANDLKTMGEQKACIVGLAPPAGADAAWPTLDQAALGSLSAAVVHPVLLDYAKMSEALRANQPAAFNQAVAALAQDLGPAAAAPGVRAETYMNQIEPFYRGLIIYLMAFLCVCVSWLAWGPELRRAAGGLVLLGFGLQTAGMAARVYITGFAPIVDLYSSALFVGWVAVVAGLVIERFARGGLGQAVASFVGFATLVIATNLPIGGDPLELPRAVLRSNFWLSTHVTSITTGYGAMFVAGALAVGYVLTGVFTPNLDAPLARTLARLVYGVTCFATLFSFVGTMLGGIWADQSWGRFWGWDPKENGALLIVLWCAICLHARWGKLVSERAQMALAIGGNMVTAWSWFGVNLLGVGLHSYGFIAGTFWALLIFWATQLGLIGLALLPPRYWRSYAVKGPGPVTKDNTVLKKPLLATGA